MDKYINGYENRKERYAQYDTIDNIINENIQSGKYIENAFCLDRLSSENMHMFVIRFKDPHCNIVFNSISEFINWINGQ